MEPWLSWTIAVGIGGGAAYYYTQTGTPKVDKLQADKLQVPVGKRRQDKSTDPQTRSSGRDTTSNDVGGAGMSKKRKARKDGPRDQPKAMPNQNESATLSEPEDDDREWAEQLRAAQKGVSVNGPSKTTKASKSKATKQAGNGAATAPQPERSQVTLGTDTKISEEDQPSGKDVSDMLETSSAGPAVLRLTGEAKAQKTKPRAPSPEKETKKQRQNRKKVEEKKLAREQEEKDRKVLQENQRRTAREARGEPAKNGIPAAVPTSSAWNQKSTGSSAVNGKGSLHDQPSSGETSLLDTFDHDAVSNASSNGPHTSAITPASGASAYDVDLPSEEAQLTMLNEQDSSAGWNEVGKGRKGKKKAPGFADTTDGQRSNATYNGDTQSQSRPSGPLPTAKFGGYGDAFVKGMTSKKFHEGDSDWFVE